MIVDQKAGTGILTMEIVGYAQKQQLARPAPASIAGYLMQFAASFKQQQ